MSTMKLFGGRILVQPDCLEVHFDGSGSTSRYFHAWRADSELRDVLTIRADAAVESPEDFEKAIMAAIDEIRGVRLYPDIQMVWDEVIAEVEAHKISESLGRWIETRPFHVEKMIDSVSSKAPEKITKRRGL